MGESLIPVLIVAFRTVPKGLEERLQHLKIRGITETIQVTVMLRSSRIFTNVMEN